MSMTPTQATNLIKMLCPVGGLIRPEPGIVPRARLCRELYDHLRADGGRVPEWLRKEVTRVGA
jgi:hypothetical protein